MNRNAANQERIRYITLSLHPARGLVHPVDNALAAEPAVTCETLSHLRLCQEEIGVLLYQLRGEPIALDDDLSQRSDVVLYDTISTQDGRFQLYLHVRISERGILSDCILDHGLVIDPPVVFSGRDRLRLTVIGTPKMIQRAMGQLPSEITFSVERLGQYENDEWSIVSSLTDRQREVVETAFRMGYYEIPRQTTHQDIAAALDLSGSTIDEHLQKAECKIMEQILA